MTVEIVIIILDSTSLNFLFALPQIIPIDNRTLKPNIPELISAPEKYSKKCRFSLTMQNQCKFFPFSFSFSFNKVYIQFEYFNILHNTYTKMLQKNIKIFY